MMKRLISLLALFVVSPFFVSWRIYRRWTGREGLFVAYSQLLSLVPGKSGVYLRRAYYSMAIDECGEDLYVGFGTTFSHPMVKIARRVYIGGGCTIGMVDIREGAMIGSNVDILSGRHQHFRDEMNRLSDSQEGRFEWIGIGENSWIGNSAVIMATVGKNCTVGAGSVVAKSAMEGQTVVGNPARPVGGSKAREGSYRNDVASSDT